MINYFVIKHDAYWKSLFDILLLLASVYNTFTQGFYSAFGEPHEIYRPEILPVMQFIDETFEIMFYMDFIFCFLQEYQDQESSVYIGDVTKIAKNYVRGSCLFDLLACLPFSLILGGKVDIKARLFRLLKLFRVPRLVELLNVNRIKRNINDYYTKGLVKAVEQNRENETYPILKTLLLIQIYKIFRLMVIILTSSYFLGIIWHIFVCDV